MLPGLQRTPALPTLRFVLPHQGLIAIADQAIAFAAARGAFTAIT
jgi:hypothetical protein